MEAVGEVPVFQYVSGFYNIGYAMKYGFEYHLGS